METKRQKGKGDLEELEIWLHPTDGSLLWISERTPAAFILYSKSMPIYLKIKHTYSVYT